jgi:hypothetical protein
MCPLFFYQSLTENEIFRQLPQNSPILNFTKICSVVFKLYVLQKDGRADGRTEGRTERLKLAFCRDAIKLESRSLLPSNLNMFDWNIPSECFAVPYLHRSPKYFYLCEEIMKFCVNRFICYDFCN